MKHFLAWLRRQFTSMVYIENAAVGKDTIQDVKDFFHRPRVVLVPAVEFRKGIDNHECWLQVGHDLYEIGDIIGVVHNVKTATKVGGIEYDEVSVVRLRAKRG